MRPLALVSICRSVLIRSITKCTDKIIGNGCKMLINLKIYLYQFLSKSLTNYNFLSTRILIMTLQNISRCHVVFLSGEHIASFFLDPYTRPAEKRGGAWMSVCFGECCLEKFPFDKRDFFLRTWKKKQKCPSRVGKQFGWARDCYTQGKHGLVK